MDIKILVASHKKAEMPEDGMYISAGACRKGFAPR